MTSVTRTLRNRTYAFAGIGTILAVIGFLPAASAPAQAVETSSNEVTATSQDNGYYIFNKSDQSFSLADVRQKSRGQNIRDVGNHCDDATYARQCTWGEGFGTSPQDSIAAHSGEVSGLGYFDIPAFVSWGITDDGTDVVYATPSGTEVTFSARADFRWTATIPVFWSDYSGCVVSSPDPEIPATIGCKVKPSRGVGTQTEFTVFNK